MSLLPQRNYMSSQNGTLIRLREQAMICLFGRKAEKILAAAAQTSLVGHTPFDSMDDIRTIE
jgi:hypothetical protein